MIPVFPLYWLPCRLLQKFIGVSQAEAAAVASDASLGVESQALKEANPSQGMLPQEHKPNTDTQP